MSEIHKSELDEQLAERRLLTEVDHLRTAMDDVGQVPAAVLDDVRLNLRTAVSEIAMPLAVTTTYHKMEHRLDETGQRRRVITWLGKTAVETAESGRQYHFSEPAFRRVVVEVAEARQAEDRLHPGVAQVFISPKMSQADAPAAVARAEHLYDEDSIRVSYAVTDSAGQVVGRRLQSLLLSDVPLGAWVAMLRDPNNIFGQSFQVRDEASALSVMELFNQLELQEESLPEGPVNIVEAVLPYVREDEAAASVGEQLGGFRKDQAAYGRQAQLTSDQWLDFDLELARSLESGRASYAIERQIAVLQNEWNREDLLLINNHSLDDGGYIMTEQLAARLEGAKQNLLGCVAALATNNQKVLAQIDSPVAEHLRAQIAFLQEQNISLAEQTRRLATLERNIARQNFRLGGGCAGDTSGKFDSGSPGGIVGENGKSNEEGSWSWKKGKCRVQACPSPQPTEVGPCNVCRRCQAKFDAGQDPTKLAVPSPANRQAGARLFNLLGRSKVKKTSAKNHLALAA